MVETGGSSGTRNSDSLTRTLGDEYSQDEGTFFIEFSAPYQSLSGINLILSSGVSRSFVRSTEADEFQAYNGTITRDYPSITPSGDFEKIAASFKSGEWILARNGASTVYSTTSDTILDISELIFFEVSEGIIARFEYWPTVKTAEELEALTANT